MAQFDYYAIPGEAGYWLDCQSDWMESYETRFVVPLVPITVAPQPSAARLNPRFEIGGQSFEMLTQFAGTVPAEELDRRSGSLAHDRYTILNALDFLLTGV
ncbi:CcdB family protein [Novosphingobium sp. B 225]|uniref:CcdB family protein n=1 Tax=Novosphingobium sp. B 225 TaxID=1961849 RepID=UPI000B4BD899|nr:CcdB family protein [Novosphingobium sp. B 225]